MPSMYKPNISATGRWASAVAGTALALAGYKRKNNLLTAAGYGLIARGASGICPVNLAIGRNTASKDTRVALAGSRGIKVDTSTTIFRPQEEVYAYWRQFENLPRFMYNILDVIDLGDGRSRWTAKGPMGVNVSWEAEIINDIPPELISWRTLPDSDVVIAGSVRFKRAGGDFGTEVRINLQYDPPAGKVGATLAWLAGEDPQRQIEEDLWRFKQLLEAGEVATGARYRTAKKGWRKDAAGTDIVSEPIPIT